MESVKGKLGKDVNQVEAVEYSTQIVSGTNYHVVVKLNGDDTRRAHVHIFEPLPG